MNLPSEDLNPSSLAEPATAAPIPSRLHSIFFGDDGLRAGWSLMAFAAILFAAIALANVIGHKLHPPSTKHGPDTSISITTLLLNDSIAIIATLLATWGMSRIERRPFSTYGLGGTRKLSRFFAGMVWGVTFLSLLVFSLWKMGFLAIDGQGLFGSDILRYGALWLGGFLLVAFTEELLFRGYIQYTLSRGLAGFYRWAFKTPHSVVLGFWSSAAFWAFLFGFGHRGNAGESPIGLVCASLAALLFCLTLWRTGSLWFAIGLHTTWDYAQSFLYGVGDSGLFMRQRLLLTHPSGKLLFSGGATGPEGSVFVLPIMALIVVVVLVTLPRTNAGYTARLES